MAPFWGRAQTVLQSSVPRALLLALGVLFGASILLLASVAVRRIRDHRAMRYLLVAAALAMAALPAFLVERESLLTEAVERVHLVLFSLVALFFYRAFGSSPETSGWYLPALVWTSTVVVGILDETVQGLVAVRTGEIYDVGLNAYSAAVGTLLWIALLGLPESSPHWPSKGRRRLGQLMVGALLLLAAFYDRNHLGYDIENPEIGRFSSYVRVDRFEELNRDRAGLWAETPPGPPFSPLELEDRFLTEAAWRLSHRNHRHEIGDWFSAWYENRILELYFPSVLDLPIVIDGVRSSLTNGPATTNRWGPEQRANVDAQRPRPDPKIYVSPVQPGRIFVWPGRSGLWLLVLGLCVLVGAVTQRR